MARPARVADAVLVGVGGVVRDAAGRRPRVGVAAVAVGAGVGSSGLRRLKAAEGSANGQTAVVAVVVGGAVPSAVSASLASAVGVAGDGAEVVPLRASDGLGAPAVAAV